MGVGTRWVALSISDTDDLLGFSHTTVSGVDTERCEKSSKQRVCRLKHLYDKKDQSRMSTGLGRQEGYRSSHVHHLRTKNTLTPYNPERNKIHFISEYPNAQFDVWIRPFPYWHTPAGLPHKKFKKRIQKQLMPNVAIPCGLRFKGYTLRCMIYNNRRPHKFQLLLLKKNLRLS